MIHVENLTKHYGSFRALDSVHFHMDRGEVVGFLGPNGAGKTTTIKILTCNLFPESGTVKVAGFDVATDEIEIQRRIGYLAESAPLYRDMRVREYLKFMGEVRGLSGARLSEAIDRVARQCGIVKYLPRSIGHLSKGYRQRVGLAQALIHEPEVLILDEPYTGLDPLQIIEIRNLIKDYGREHTVLLSSHILSEVEATCNRVLIIHEGRIVTDESAALLLHQDSVFARVIGPDPEILAHFEHFDKAKLIGSHRLGTSDGVEVHLKPEGCTLDELAMAVSAACKARDWSLLYLGPGTVTFEDLFLQFTRKSGTGA
ncbi:MAG: ABC transporter [Deltaproteobacteria bacterium HGW-Deltaproteobacteria-17]|nr:MAG: ABC transporter [Deltaproteobacteria bacterium HGW-Deltaproteobacteria-17]